MDACFSSLIISSLWCVRALSVLCCVQAQEAVCNRLAELLAVSSNHDLLMASRVTQRILGTLRANGGHTGVQVSTRALRCSSTLPHVSDMSSTCSQHAAVPPTSCPVVCFGKAHRLCVVGYRLNARERDTCRCRFSLPAPLGFLFECVRCKACLRWPTWLVTTTSRT